MQWVTRNRTKWTLWKGLASLTGLAGVLLAGCSSDPLALTVANPSYLGARDVGKERATATSTDPRVNSSKVLSAIVFERVTGLPIDPARLVQP